MRNVVLSVASQLTIADPTILARYREGQMRYDHIHEIMQEYGYHDFASQPEHFRFLRWLYIRAWWSEERLTVLFDLAMAHLIERRVLLPGVSVLERLISSIRDHASMRLWQLLAHLPAPRQVALLETLLVVPEGERQTPLDRLRRGPTRASSPALVSALHRIDAIRLFEVEHVDLSFVPKGRVKALVHNLRQLADDHRIATLLAFAHTYLAVVHNDALDLFDALMKTAFSAATREGQQERLRTIHDLDAAAQVLAEACQVVLDEAQDPVTLLTRIYARVSAPHLQAAVATIGELTRPPDDTYAQELLGRHLMMRRFLPTLLRFDHFHHLLKSFSKTEAYGTWLFWAMFLFRLSVPTMGKPQIQKWKRQNSRNTLAGHLKSIKAMLCKHVTLSLILMRALALMASSVSASEHITICRGRIG